VDGGCASGYGGLSVTISATGLGLRSDCRKNSTVRDPFGMIALPLYVAQVQRR
jgi:hypothetical protein